MKLALDPAMMNARPIEDAIAATAAAGYRYLELGNRDDLIGAFKGVAADSATLSHVRQWAVDAAVEITSVAVIQAWSSPDEAIRTQAVAWWHDGIAAVAALGCSRINTELSGDPGRSSECRAAFLRSIESLLPTLEAEGIDVVAEPHPGDFIETTAAAIELVRLIDSPRLRYLHCVPHTFYLGGAPSDQIEEARGWFDHIHVADTFRPGRIILNPPGSPVRIHQHFDIGQGEIDWEQVAGALGSIGFDGTVTVQVFLWDERAEESFQANHTAAQRLFGDQARPLAREGA